MVQFCDVCLHRYVSKGHLKKHITNIKLNDKKINKKKVVSSTEKRDKKYKNISI